MEAPNPMVQLAPLLIWLLMFAIIGYVIAKRKADNAAGWAILCAVPIVGPIALIFLVSRTDKAVLRELEELRQAIAGRAKSDSSTISS